jgi:N-acetylglucosamine-6-sulfatase
MTKLLFLACFLLGGVGPFPARAEQRPNILFVMADDHAAHAIRAYGGRLQAFCRTPHLDRLANEGMLLENCFCANSICTPSRATILTGQYNHMPDNGYLVFSRHNKTSVFRQLLPRHIREAGYQTAMIGKWHLHEEPAFDYYKVLPGQGRYMDPQFIEKGKGQGKDWRKGRELVEEKGHSSDVITDLSLAWLKQRDKQKPFFLGHHFKATHGPFTCAPRFEHLFEDVDIPEPASLHDRGGNYGSIATRGENDALVRDIGSSVSGRNMHRGGGGKKWATESEAVRKAKAHQSYQSYLKRYLQCVAGIDENVGRLLAYLEGEGILDQTVIIYTSDQGMMLGEHDYNDKRWMHEESMRMPFIIRYPKLITAGSRSDELVNNTDFAPTILALVGTDSPSVMQGCSFLPILRGRVPADWRQGTFYRYWMHMKQLYVPAHMGIRTKRYKLVLFYGMHFDPTARPKSGQGRDWYERGSTPAAWELYDLQRDPGEMRNVYSSSEYADVVKKLKADLRDLRDETGDAGTDRIFPHLGQVIREHWDD